MNLEGDIWELELIPRLIELGSQSFTGALRFENDSVIKIVYFKEGNILSASTNDRADSIDEILLRSGKVTRDHVKQALSKRKETETLGDALLGLGFIAKRELAWARRVQLIGILRSIGEWQAGSFTIVADYLPKREEGTAFPLPQIVLELILTDQDRSKYEKALESGSAVFRKSPSFHDSFPALGLNQEAETITARIDGVLTAAEIASESGSDAFNVYKLLNALSLLGLVEKLEKSLEVSSPGQEQAVAGFGAATGATMEMSLDFGRDNAAIELGDELAAHEPSGADFEIARLDTDSSVPPGDLDSYSYEAPVTEESEDLGIGYQDASAPTPRGATPSPASSDGLGSIEALRNFEVPAAQFPPIEERIAQKQEKRKTLNATPVPRGRRTGIIAAVAAVVVVALAAAGGWYYFESTRATEPVVSVEQRPASVRPPATETTAEAAPEKGETSSESAATSAPEAAKPELNARIEIPAAMPAAAPRTSPTPATATPRAPEPRTATPAPAQQSPAVKPAQTSVTPSASKYAAQAQQYAKEAATVPFTVQFALVCRDASIENNVRIGGSKIWYVPISYRGETCYKVYWGRYSTREQADRAVAEIPTALRAGKPSVVSPGAGSR
ncbi:MAG: hypothetical protein NDJ92_16185 [Thermoanaerobaculia bacterium]|nr:hypothetical protein [Thermoanaerobaculia bacterium]